MRKRHSANKAFENSSKIDILEKLQNTQKSLFRKNKCPGEINGLND